MITLLSAFTLFGSVWIFWVSVVVLLALFFTSDINENGYLAFGSLVVVAFCYYFWGDIKTILPLFSFINISIYLLLGLVFSMIRTFFATREFGKQIKDLPITSDTHFYSGTQKYEKEIFIKKLEGNVFRWWFMWPISLINWLISDLIADIWEYVYSKISGVYNYIAELGFKSVGIK